eukprot:SAG11_NODE_9_length_28972_cov_81.532539_13_plen_209_part_00
MPERVAKGLRSADAARPRHHVRVRQGGQLEAAIAQSLQQRPPWSGWPPGEQQRRLRLTDDFYEDMKQDSDKYDMSNFDCDLTSQFKDNTNKKVVGKFKDEGDGQVWSEMVGLRPKMYSATLHNGKEKKTGKGIKRCYLQNDITHADYVRCIESDDIRDQRQLASFQCIRSSKHNLASCEVTKTGLCCYDNKRYLLDSINSLAYGHYKI